VRSVPAQAGGAVLAGAGAAAPRDPADGGTPEAEPGGGAAFNRRVGVVIEIVDEPQEIVAVEGALAASGWLIGPVGEADRESIGPRRVRRVVEVRLRGSRRWARAAGARQVRDLLATRELCAQVRGASLIEFSPEPLVEYQGAHGEPVCP